MSPASRTGAASAVRSSPLPSMDQFFSFRSAIHLHGSTPHRKSGVVSGQRAEWHTAEPIRGKHDRMPAFHDGRASARRNGGAGASASGAGTTSTLAATRFRSARRRSPAGRRHSLYEQFHWAMTSGVTAGPIQGSGLQGQVTTATPFAPRGAGHQEGHGSRQLTSAGCQRQDRAYANGASRGTFWVALHRRLMRFHFPIHDDRQATPGVDEKELGLWS